MLLTGRAAPTAILALLLLGGCTGDEPEPSPAPTVTSSATPSPTPSAPPTPTPSEEPVTAPEPPAELERTDEVGAAAAAEYFLELYSYTMQTGDVSAWDAMSSDDCEFCASTRQLAIEITTSGETFIGGDIVPASTQVLPRDDLIGGYPVDLEVIQAPSFHLSPDGAVLSESPSQAGVVRVDTLRTNTGWRILAVVSKED